MLVCQPDQGLPASESPCYAINGVHSAPALVTSYLLTSDQGTSFEAMEVPFDYAQATGFWMLAFTSVLILWFVSKSAGTILSLIRRG